MRYTILLHYPEITEHPDVRAAAENPDGWLLTVARNAPATGRTWPPRSQNHDLAPPSQRNMPPARPARQRMSDQRGLGTGNDHDDHHSSDHRRERRRDRT